MMPKQYASFFLLMHRFASMRPVVWFYSRTVPHLDSLALRLSRRRMTLTGLLAGLPVVVVNTVGAKSGKARAVPLLFIRDESDPKAFALIASNWGQRHNPAWYFNLKTNPRVTCAVAGQVGAYVAQEAVGEEYERFWRYAADTYLGYPLYRQRAGERHIPIMVMRPLNG